MYNERVLTDRRYYFNFQYYVFFFLLFIPQENFLNLKIFHFRIIKIRVCFKNDRSRNNQYKLRTFDQKQEDSASKSIFHKLEFCISSCKLCLTWPI